MTDIKPKCRRVLRTHLSSQQIRLIWQRLHKNKRPGGAAGSSVCAVEGAILDEGSKENVLRHGFAPTVVTRSSAEHTGRIAAEGSR